MQRILIATIILASTCSNGLMAQEPATQPSHVPIILLKLDDAGGPVSARWKRVYQYLTEKHIRASFGVIGEALEKAPPETIDWIKKIHDDGQIEIWCHGWHGQPPKGPDGKFGPGEFAVGTADEQAELLHKAEDIAEQKLGFDYVAFGPHWSAYNDDTDKAMSMEPRLKIWLYGPVKPKFFKGLSIPRFMALENPTFIPSFEKFKDAYDKFGHKQAALVLQGHPDMWVDPARWEGFTKIIDFLQSKNSTFMTPSEYAATLAPTTQPTADASK